MNCCVTWTGPLFIAIAVVLISGGVYAFLSQILPFLEPSPTLYYIHASIAVYISAMIMFHYWMAIRVHAGVPEEPAVDSSESNYDSSTVVLNVGTTQRTKRCRKCELG